MAVALTELLKKTPNPLLAGIVESVTNEDALFRRLPFYRYQGGGLGFSFLRVKSLPTASFVDVNGSIPSTQGTYEPCLAAIRTIAEDIDVSGSSFRLQGNVQVVPQLAMGAVSLARKFKDAMVNGNYGTLTIGAAMTGVAVASVSESRVSGPDGGLGPGWLRATEYGLGAIKCRVDGGAKYISIRAPGDITYGSESVDAASGNPVLLLRSDSPHYWARMKITSASLPATTTEDTLSVASSTYEIDGLVKLVDPAQLIDPTGTNGDNLSVRTLRLLANQVATAPGSEKVYVMHSRDLIDLREVLDAAGGTGVRDLVVPNYGAGPVPTFDGIPILVNDNILITETTGSSTDCSRIYCANIGLPNPTEDAPLKGPGIFGIYGGTSSMEAEGRTCAGMMVESIGAKAGYDLRTYRLTWDAGLVAYAKLGLACAWGITPTP